MSSTSTAYVPISAGPRVRSRTWHIAGYVYFTFICYVSIGLPLAVLPPFVHLRMGYSAVLAGLAISIQYIATLLSRPWAGRISDHMGAKVSVLVGHGRVHGERRVAGGRGGFAPGALAQLRGADREPPGAGSGREPGFDRSNAVGHYRAGHEHTAKVIGLNGISTYGGMALAAPLGVMLDQQWGLESIGVLTILIGAVSLPSLGASSPLRSSRASTCPSAMCWAAWPRTAWDWLWPA